MGLYFLSVLGISLIIHYSLLDSLFRYSYWKRHMIKYYVNYSLLCLMLNSKLNMIKALKTKIPCSSVSQLFSSKSAFEIHIGWGWSGWQLANFKSRSDFLYFHFNSTLMNTRCKHHNTKNYNDNAKIILSQYYTIIMPAMQ